MNKNRPAGVLRFDPLAANYTSGGMCGSLSPLVGFAPMTDKNQIVGKSADSTSGRFTLSQYDDGSRANERQNAGGESVAGCPAQRSVRNGTYQTQRHNFSARAGPSENVPSAGWKAVYAAMGVPR